MNDRLIRYHEQEQIQGNVRGGGNLPINFGTTLEFYLAIGYFDRLC